MTCFLFSEMIQKFFAHVHILAHLYISVWEGGKVNYVLKITS